MRGIFRLVLLIMLSLHRTSAFALSFVPISRFSATAKSVSTDPTMENPLELKPAAVNMAGRYFQMEEMEDSETRTTCIVLHPNGTIITLASDIPSFKEASGTWEQTEDGSFRMNVVRTFSAGRKGVLDTDMGVFEFSMERLYTGEFIFVGANAAAEGTIHLIGDEKVGFFSMIDTEMNPNDQSFNPLAGFSQRLSTGG